MGVSEMMRYRWHVAVTLALILAHVVLWAASFYSP